jgi:hypothetical protein
MAVSQHQASVRREAAHIRARRLELIKWGDFLRIGTEREASHEASDDFCYRGCRSNLHSAAGVNKLPNDELEDMSLVYPNATKRYQANSR